MPDKDKALNTENDPRNTDPKYPKSIDPAKRISGEVIEKGIEFISLDDFLADYDLPQNPS